MLQIFLTRSQWGLAVLLMRSLKVLPLDLTKMATCDNQVLENRFNSAYYLAKKERPYSDFPDLIELQEKMELSIAEATKTNELLLTLLIIVGRP